MYINDKWICFSQLDYYKNKNKLTLRLQGDKYSFCDCQNYSLDYNDNLLDCEPLACKGNYCKQAIEKSLNHNKRLIIKLHNYCNAQCYMCTKKNLKNINERTVCKYKDFFNKKSEFHLSDFNEIRLTGGELFLTQDELIECIKYIRKYNNGCIIKIHTNGSVKFLDSTLKYLEQANVTIIFSVDGHRQNHDRIRPGCKYESIIDNYHTIISNYNNIKIEINFTLSNMNYRYAYNDITSIKSDMLKAHLYINYCNFPFDYSIFNIDDEEFFIVFLLLNKLKSINIDYSYNLMCAVKDKIRKYLKQIS